MTENQLAKLKRRLINVQSQLAGAETLLSRGEPFINSKLQEANKLVGAALEMCEKIKPCDNPPGEKFRKQKLKDKYYSEVREVIIARNEPPTYNLVCRNYSETRNRKNEVIERTCLIGMDLCYCSKKCAYATNNVCSTTDNGRIGGKWR